MRRSRKPFSRYPRLRGFESLLLRQNFESRSQERLFCWGCHSASWSFGTLPLGLSPVEATDRPLQPRSSADCQPGQLIPTTLRRSKSHLEYRCQPRKPTRVQLPRSIGVGLTSNTARQGGFRAIYAVYATFGLGFGLSICIRFGFRGRHV